MAPIINIVDIHVLTVHTALTSDLPTMKRIEERSLATEAYLLVRERILRGDLPIGKVISRRKLASELGVSMLPVSEAFQRLEFEGLLESRARAGTRVRIPTEQDVRGHYVVREALEVESARLFAEAATASERAEVRKLAARVDHLSVQLNGDRFLYLSLHEKLHRHIAECARCPALSEAIEKNHVMASTWLCVPRSAAPDHPPRRHQDLIDVLTSGDVHAAGEAMREHVVRGLHNTLQRLEPYLTMSEVNGKIFARSSNSRSLKKQARKLDNGRSA
ncbi:MAG TPA: GntR family transcriptional regulator [Pyrinomonadaceae bacterium]|jgi:DNA-binding GntR family transcriptional regulator|nr:GntR family transcriptional regulator [Pyrinomonadaceae bacterium]